MNQPTLNDLTEDIRCALVVLINSLAAERAELEDRYGRVWTPAELALEFELIGFAAPFAVVRRKTDHQLGSVLFQHWPRYYFSFLEDS
jgi:hypothetical protein